jgi:hypothetical protein
LEWHQGAKVWHRRAVQSSGFSAGSLSFALNRFKRLQSYKVVGIARDFLSRQLLCADRALESGAMTLASWLLREQ